MTDEQLSALLRLKRFEQPPEGYFDQLLRDIHRRQRAELLRRPLWRIAVERVQTFFSEHSMGHGSFAGAMATVLIAGMAAIGVLTPDPQRQDGRSVAAAQSVSTAPGLTLQASTPPRPELDEQIFSTRDSRRASALAQRRYVIDVQPASYEPSFSF